MRLVTRILFSLPHNGGAHSAPARERRGAQGSPQATEPGSGAEPRSQSDRRLGRAPRAPRRGGASQIASFPKRFDLFKLGPTLRETTRAIVSDAFRDLRGSWRALALTDLAYKLVSFALLTPATLLLLRWAMARTGTAVVADVEIASFFLTTRPGILSLILGGAILTGITALEMACLMAIGLAAVNGRELNVRGALAFGASRALLVLRLTANMVARLLVGLLPFAAAIGLVYWTLMRDHDINFYLSQRPPSFWAAVSIAAVIVALLVVLLVRTLARWALALPLVLFEGIVPRRALGESATRLTGRRSTAIAALAVWAVLAVALLGVAASVPDFIGRGLAPRFSGSMEMLLAFITALLLLWAVFGLAAAVVNVSMLSLVLLRLYLRVAEGRESGALRTPAFDTGESVARLPGAVRIAAAIVSILAVLGAVLVVVNVARQNQPVMVIAHRGASAAAPENTLAAFRLARRTGRRLRRARRAGVRRRGSGGRPRQRPHEGREDRR